MTYAVGIVGLGSIGQRMLAAMSEHRGLEVVSVWDPAAPACTKARSLGCEVAADAKALVSDPRLDLIYIACPPRRHCEHVLAALAAGKAVLCEKPLSVDLEQSRQMVAAAERSGSPSAVNLLYGSARSGAIIAASLADASLGEPVWVEGRLHLPRWAALRLVEAPWLATSAQGGFVREVTTHYVYLCQRLFGRLTLRHASLRGAVDGGAETFASFELDAGGVAVTITGTTAGVGPEVNELIVWGTRRSYRIRDLHRLDVARDDAWAELASGPTSPERDTHLRQLDQVVTMLEGKAHTLPSFEAALRVQHIVESILNQR